MKEGKKPSEKKINAVKEIKELALKYKTIALINMENIPGLQLKKIKKQLKSSMFIKVYKKRVISIALSEAESIKKGISGLSQHITGISAIVFSNEDPFRLQKSFSKNKSKAPAKSGQIAPTDLIINAGQTPFMPGPIIGELGQLGIKTEVKEGKVAIKENKLLVKKGEIINKKSADLLFKLGIEPMEIGLNLLVAYENDLIYLKDILSVSEEEYLNNLKRATLDSFIIALAINYISNETIRQLIKKASRESNALSPKIDLSKVAIKEEPLKKQVEETSEEKKKPTANQLVEEAERETKDEVKDIEKLTRDILSGKLKR